MKLLPSLFSKRQKRRYPVKKDSKGRSVRARAFEMFERGLRPSELPDLGVPQTTLYRYFQSWKHRRRDETMRSVMVKLRRAPASQARIASYVALDESEVSQALRQRNPMAALRRAMGTRLSEMFERLDELSADELATLCTLLRNYQGRDRFGLVERLASWANPKLVGGSLRDGKDMVVLTLVELADEVRQVEEASKLVQGELGLRSRAQYRQHLSHALRGRH